MKKIIFLLLLVVAIGGAYYGYSEFNRGLEGVGKAEHSLTCADLFSEFENDEKAANSKYLGKVVEIDGTISDINTNKEGKTTISLEGGMLFGVTCELFDGKEASKYKKGQKVKLKGECSGFLSDVVLVRCVGS